jgi:hypothetical protein
MRYSLAIIAILWPLPTLAADYSDWKAPPPIATPEGGDYLRVGRSDLRTYQLTRKQMRRHGLRPGQRVEARKLLEILEKERRR